MKKRLLAFVMASVMAVGLTGCGGGEVGAGSTMSSGSAAGTGNAAGASQGVSGGIKLPLKKRKWLSVRIWRAKA